MFYIKCLTWLSISLFAPLTFAQSFRFTANEIKDQFAQGAGIPINDLRDRIRTGVCINLDPDLGPVDEYYYGAIRIVSGADQFQAIGTYDSLYEKSYDALVGRFDENIHLGYASLSSRVEEQPNQLYAILNSSDPAQYIRLREKGGTVFTLSTYSDGSYSDVCYYDFEALR